MITNRYKTIAQFCSNDETRQHLMNAYASEFLGGLVATDGHKLLLAKGIGAGNWGKIVPGTMLKAGEATFINLADGVKFPNLESIAGDLKNGVEPMIQFQLPAWLKNIAKARLPVNARIYLNGVVQLRMQGQKQVSEIDVDFVSLDLRHLSAFAGEEIDLEIKTQMVQHAESTGDEKSVLEVQKMAPIKFACNDFLGLIMPMKE